MIAKNMKKLSIGLIGMAGAMAAAMPAQAVDFSGERIEWIVPFKEGGGSSNLAHFYAPLLSEQLPGKPTIVVKNVPGGGSITGTNQFATRAKPDGLTILVTSGSTQFPYLLGDQRVRYEYKDWNVILATPTGGVAYVASGMGVESPADIAKLKGQSLVYGSQGATSLDLVPLLAFEMLGLDVKAVFGMKGRGAGRLAFERGEANIDYQTTSAYLSKSVPLVKEGKAVPLMSWGALDADGNVVRDPSFPELPSFPEAYEMVHGKKPSGEMWDAWKAFFTAGFPGQKMVFLPKDTPQDVVDTWRDAVNKALAAPGYNELATKVLGRTDQVGGKQAATVMKAAITVPPAAKAWVRNWLTEKYNVKF